MQLDYGYFSNLFDTLTKNIESVNKLTIITLLVVVFLIFGGKKIGPELFIIGRFVAFMIISYSFYRNVFKLWDLSTKNINFFTNPELYPIQQQLITNYIYTFALLFIAIFLFLSLFQ
jgi:glycerol uptake facilitator-like aquaporin